MKDSFALLNHSTPLWIIVKMIEFCTKKRMAAAIIGLIGVSMVVLAIENNISIDHDMKDATHAPDNASKPCWEEYPTETVEECVPCSAFEVKLESFCRQTGYREVIKCKLPNNVDKTLHKSCPKLSWLEERNFWIFESLVAVLGLVGYGMVHSRQNLLDKQLLEKVHKQIAAGI